MPERQHGTAVAVGGRAVLIRGPSGAGKSDLALRLIAGGYRWPGLEGEPRLVGDDQVELTAVEGEVIVSAPATIAGMLEVRGVGIVRLPHVPLARLVLVVDLVGDSSVPRLPEPASITLAGRAVPRLFLEAFTASAPIKVLAALAGVE